jgi:phosphoribosylaminoimidazole-succinocarboxamide synthase
MSDEWISTISGRYIELYEKLIGKPFVPEAIADEETYNKIVAALDKLP